MVKLSSHRTKLPLRKRCGGRLNDQDDHSAGTRIIQQLEINLDLGALAESLSLILDNLILYYLRAL